MTDPQRIIDRLSRSRRVLVTTHVKPDGDALGSTAAMVLALRRKGIDGRVLLLSKLPDKYAFAYDAARVPFDVLDGPVDLGPYDTLLVVDTGTWNQLPGLKEPLSTWAGTKLVVDHHVTQEHWADARYVDTTAAAAGEMVAKLLVEWGVELTADIAEPLYLALVSDTGWFQYSNTTPATLRLAADLMATGIDTDSLYQRLYQNERPQRLAVQAKAMRSLQWHADGRVAVMRVSADDYRSADATSEDTEGLINLPLQVRTTAASILVTEPLVPGPIRVSLRSKGVVDVARFAQQFGGGGHARAAGLKLDGTLDDIADRVTAAMVDALATSGPSTGNP